MTTRRWNKVVGVAVTTERKMRQTLVVPSWDSSGGSDTDFLGVSWGCSKSWHDSWLHWHRRFQGYAAR